MVGLLLVLLTVAVLAGPVLIRRRVSVGVAVLAIGYPMFAVLTVLLYRPTAAQMSGIDAFPNQYFAGEPAALTLGAFTVLGVCCYAGGLLVNLLGPTGLARAERRQIELQLPAAALWVCALALVCEVVGIGPATVLHSSAYLGSTGPGSLLSVGSALLPVALLVGGNVMFSPRHGRGVKTVAFLTLLPLELLSFGQATRTFALSFVLIFAGAWLTGRWSSRQAVARGIGAGAIALLALGVPLRLRGLSEHGLVPALHYFFTDPMSFFSGQSNPLYNALFGVPLSVYEWRQIPPIGNHALAVSVNPLPGGAAGWIELAPSLRLNQFEPFSAVGELLNHGWTVAIVFSLVLGAVVEALTMIARSAPGQWAGGIQALIAGLCGLLLIRSTQYNLRTEARYVYYMIFAVLALSVFARALHVRHRSGLGASRSVERHNDDGRGVRPAVEQVHSDLLDVGSGLARP